MWVYGAVASTDALGDGLDRDACAQAGTLCRRTAANTLSGMRPRSLRVPTAPEPDVDGRLVRIGVEHELCMWRDHERVDFRSLLPQLAGHIAPLDPGDPRARRLPSGVALTADGWEAELASPPLPLGPDAAHDVDRLLRSERTELNERAQAHGVTRISGFSTHLNITVPDHRATAIGRSLLQTCALGLAAVTEPTGSSGVFVRPRRGRLEVGGEYVEGERLVAAIILLAACVRGLQCGSAPQAHAPRALASREKFGWFVPPEELEPSVLPGVWDWAREWCLELGLDAGPVDRVVNAPHPGAECSFGGDAIEVEPLRTHRRLRPGGVSAETEWLTWQHVVWAFHDPHGSACRAVVPVEQEGDFLRALDSGALDTPVERMLRRRGIRRRLVVNAQIGQPGLWHDVRPGALVPAERGPDGSVPRVSRRLARRDLLRSRSTR